MASFVGGDGEAIDYLELRDLLRPDQYRECRMAIATHLRERCGWSLRDVGRAFGCSKDTAAALGMLSLEPAPELGTVHPDDITAFRRHVARTMAKRGWRNHSIGEVLGCSGQQASRLARKPRGKCIEESLLDRKIEVNPFDDFDL